MKSHSLRRHLIVIILTILSLHSLGQNQNKSKYEILFIGSSYFGGNNLPSLCKNLIENAQKEVFIDNYNPGGLYLADHASSTITTAKIKEREWDFVILQGVGSLMAYPDYYTHHPVYPALQNLKSKIKDNCESTRIIYCLPWAFEDGMIWVSGWDDTYEDMQILIYERTIQYANEIGFTIAPVGWAWYKILDEKNYPLHYLHLSDWNHPSLKGSFVMANVIYSTIYLESTMENQYNAGLDMTEANYFKEIASSTVLDDLELWNISEYIDSTYSDTTSNDTTYTGNLIPKQERSFKLYQNYPNPFSSSTTIKYELLKKSKVKVELTDYLGNSCAILVNGIKLPGIYTLKIDGNKYKPGNYFYSIKTDTDYLIRQMQIVK